MSDLVLSSSLIAARSVPRPTAAGVNIRAGTLADIPFIDGLQKQHAKQVGWMPRGQLEEKVRLGQVLVAEEAGGSDERETMNDEVKAGDASWTSPRSVGARTMLTHAAASNDSGLT